MLSFVCKFLTVCTLTGMEQGDGGGLRLLLFNFIDEHVCYVILGTG